MIFSDSARKAGIAQYFDNRHIYGYLAFDEGASGHVAGGFDIAQQLMAQEGGASACPGRHIRQGLHEQGLGRCG